jgi:hypothetical protein
MGDMVKRVVCADVRTWIRLAGSPGCAREIDGVTRYQGIRWTSRQSKLINI